MILIMDWAALDDITTGKESNYLGEYIVLFISIPLVLILTSGIIIKRKKYF